MSIEVEKKDTEKSDDTFATDTSMSPNAIINLSLSPDETDSDKKENPDTTDEKVIKNANDKVLIKEVKEVREVKEVKGAKEAKGAKEIKKAKGAKETLAEKIMNNSPRKSISSVKTSRVNKSTKNPLELAKGLIYHLGWKGSLMVGIGTLGLCLLVISLIWSILGILKNSPKKASDKIDKALRKRKRNLYIYSLISIIITFIIMIFLHFYLIKNDGQKLNMRTLFCVGLDYSGLLILGGLVSMWFNIEAREIINQIQ